MPHLQRHNYSNRSSTSQRSIQASQSLFEENDSDSDMDQTMDMESNLPNMIKYILNHSCTKLPFKKADIVKNVLHGKNHLFPDIFSLAKTRLAEVNII